MPTIMEARASPGLTMAPKYAAAIIGAQSKLTTNHCDDVWEQGWP